MASLLGLEGLPFCDGLQVFEYLMMVGEARF